MSELLFFIIGTMLGGCIGIVIMCLLQINRLQGKDDYNLLGALIYKKPVPIQSVDELPDGLGALYDHEQEAIFVCRGMEANDLFCEVSKALAQAELAQTGEEYDPQTASFKAHCVSYILGKEFGVDVSDYSFENPADFLRTDDPQEIRTELSEIRDTAYDISARMARALEKEKSPRHTEQER